MGTPRYAPLADYLMRMPSDRQTVEMTFAEIEGIIQAELPKSSREYREWWANDARTSHVQAKEWMRVGWQVAHVQMEDERVRFVRTDGRTSADEAIQRLTALGFDPLDVVFWEYLDKQASDVPDPRWLHRFWETAAELVAVKGHPYFRIALLDLEALDKEGALNNLDRSYREDLAHSPGDPNALSAYVALATLREWECLSLSPEFTNLFSRAFTDAALLATGPEHRDVTDAIETIASANHTAHCLALYAELRDCERQGRTFASVVLAGSIAEALLSSRLIQFCDQCKVGDLNEAYLKKLWRLSDEYAAEISLPREVVQTFHLVCEFRNRVHPGRERRKTDEGFRLTARIARTVSMLMQLALTRWADYIRRQPEAEV